MAAAVGVPLAHPDPRLHPGESNGQSLRKPIVLVIGAGFAGVTAAIECKRRGLEPILIEKYTKSEQFGGEVDIIDFFQNSGIIVEGWENGKVSARLWPICLMNVKYGDLRMYDGTPITHMPWFLREHHKRRQFAGHRGELWQVLMDYAKEIHVDARVGKEVVEYLESDHGAGVRLADGEEIWGDCVVAADGPKSLARQQALGLEDDPSNSGCAIWRAYYEPPPEMLSNPLIQDYLRTSEDTFRLWTGPRGVMLAYGWKGGKSIAWVVTHPDDADIEESWSVRANKDDVLEFIKDFQPECTELVKYTPPTQLIDYKLVWRRPLDSWRSKGGRTVLIGDAAHCHLPDSAQGGSQAMEDAVTVAMCLERAFLAGDDVRLGLQVAERIRFNRSHVVHQAGMGIRDAWMESTAITPEQAEAKIGGAKWPDWVVEFNPITAVEGHYDRIAQEVKDGKKGTLEELSVPAGGVYQFDVKF